MPPRQWDKIVTLDIGRLASPLYRCKSDPQTVAHVTRTKASSGSVMSGISRSSRRTSCLPCHYSSAQSLLWGRIQVCHVARSLSEVLDSLSQGKARNREYTHDKGFHARAWLQLGRNGDIVRTVILFSRSECSLHRLGLVNAMRE